MSKENLNAKIAEITAIRDADVKQPNMPVGEPVQEAENLVAWCQEDKEALTTAGLDWLLVDDLPVRAGACRHAQSIWARESRSKEEAQKQWQAQSPAAFDLRDELVSLPSEITPTWWPRRRLSERAAPAPTCCRI